MSNIISEAVNDKPTVRVRKREERHLKWYEKQLGSGFLTGLFCGTMAGMPIAFVLYKLAVVVVKHIGS